MQSGLQSNSTAAYKEVVAKGLTAVISELTYDNVTIQHLTNGQIVLYADSPLQRFKYNLTTNQHWYSFLHNGKTGQETLHGPIGVINRHLCFTLVKWVESFLNDQTKYIQGSNKEVITSVVHAAIKMFK